MFDKLARFHLAEGESNGRNHVDRGVMALAFVSSAENKCLFTERRSLTSSVILPSAGLFKAIVFMSPDVTSWRDWWIFAWHERLLSYQYPSGANSFYCTTTAVVGPAPVLLMGLRPVWRLRLSRTDRLRGATFPVHFAPRISLLRLHRLWPSARRSASNVH